MSKRQDSKQHFVSLVRKLPVGHDLPEDETRCFLGDPPNRITREGEDMVCVTAYNLTGTRCISHIYLFDELLTIRLPLYVLFDMHLYRPMADAIRRESKVPDDIMEIQRTRQQMRKDLLACSKAIREEKAGE